VGAVYPTLVGSATAGRGGPDLWGEPGRLERIIGTDQEGAEIMNRPYSHATRGNLEVQLDVAGV
jgi:hypothetical protein